MDAFNLFVSLHRKHKINQNFTQDIKNLKDNFFKKLFFKFLNGLLPLSLDYLNIQI